MSKVCYQFKHENVRRVLFLSHKRVTSLITRGYTFIRYMTHFKARHEIRVQK
jgi:hypothetical protein